MSDGAVGRSCNTDGQLVTSLGLECESADVCDSRLVDCWSPAFRVAAACREIDVVRGEAEGESPRGRGSLEFEDDMAREKCASDGGRELRSGPGVMASSGPRRDVFLFA